MAASMVTAACTEKLDSGSACPALCPVEQLGITDTTIEGVALDTTVRRYPAIGAEAQIPLVTRIDGSLDVRAALRFDALPYTYVSGAAHAAGNTIDTIAYLDRARLLLRVDTSLARLSDSITFAAYDIDTTAVEDTATAALIPLYRPDRLLGTAKFSKAALSDTAALALPISDAAVLAKVAAKGRLRVGLQVIEAKNLDVPLRATNGLGGVILSFRASRTPGGPTLPEDSAAVLLTGLSSATPTDDATLAANLRDYAVIVRGTPPPPVANGAEQVISVGGLPGSRGYLRFEIPSRLLDSTQIVRATLRFTQLPSPTALPGDSLTVAFWMGTATTRVNDIALAAVIHESLVQVGDGSFVYGGANIRPQTYATADSARRTIEVAGLLRSWFKIAPADRPHALIIQSFTEGTRPFELRFASRDAPASIRPTLQITFVPRATAGVP